MRVLLVWNRRFFALLLRGGRDKQQPNSYIVCRPIGVGASKFLGVQRIFAQIFPNLSKKLSCKFLPTVFVVWPPKNALFHLFICKPWAPFFEVKQRWAPFLPRFSFCSDFQGFCPDFQQIKTFGGALSPSASYTTVQADIFISLNFDLFTSAIINSYNGAEYEKEEMHRKDICTTIWIRWWGWRCSVTWNRLPIKNLRLIPCFFHLWSEVTCTPVLHFVCRISLN